ncbi:LysR family transcriptional regulator [Massilia sp. WF1]|uniref:LysR substrate-binding domain-containing protein n=1 Tax=unclassified Massilia TaxID=2609279 RepID=UPI0006497B20|nr:MULTISPECIES: LysR substrate-binding domain-containing protein [unclassified Massilia]ALK98051.1 LysR family transcriptional regulator [Massilia sp. WG5]KLU35524.1 LysR family transcriptional regulator [Massilia sp. WF1]
MLDIGALIAFVTVTETGSFSTAAQQLGQTPSGVSRTVSRLEKQLGMTLMHRTTRRLDLTAEGAWLLERARRVLAEMADTEAQAAARRGHPAGLVRVNAATPTLDHLVAPLVSDFLDEYPQVSLELTSGETIVDLIEEKVDVAIRIGILPDSSLNARLLGRSRVRVLAAPGYLERHGRPATPADLARHRLLGFTAPASLNTWPLRDGSQEGVLAKPQVTASSGETLRHLALGGAGIASLSDFLTGADVAGGRLVPLLEEAALPWTQPVWAVFYKQGALAPRVAALVEFLARRLADVLET